MKHYFQRLYKLNCLCLAKGRHCKSFTKIRFLQHLPGYLEERHLGRGCYSHYLSCKTRLVLPESNDKRCCLHLMCLVACSVATSIVCPMTGPAKSSSWTHPLNHTETSFPAQAKQMFFFVKWKMNKRWSGQVKTYNQFPAGGDGGREGVWKTHRSHSQ